MRRSLYSPIVLLALGLAVVASAHAPAVAAPTAPAIAIFNDPNFPYFAAPEGLTGPDMAAWFKARGVAARVLGADELSDPAVFNARRFAVLVYLYGNTFPLEAAANLRRFHQQGGGIVSPGVPFCHPCVRTGAADWTYATGWADHCERSHEAAHSGQWGVKIVKGSTGWTGFYQSTRLPAKPGELFTVGGWVRTAGASGADPNDMIMLRFWDNAGTFLGQTGPRLPRDAARWTAISGEVTTPPRTAAVDVLLALWKPDSTVWADDLFLVRGKLAAVPASGQVPGNLLPNPGFEGGGAEWTDLGHQPWFGQDRLGTGGFLTPPQGPETLIYNLAGDPLDLAGIGAAKWPALYARGALTRAQVLDPSTLAPGDKVSSIVSLRTAGGTYPVLAFIKHSGDDFPGAIDCWAGAQLFSQGSIEDVLAQREVLGRAGLYILAQREPGLHLDLPRLFHGADAAYAALLPPSNLTPPAVKRPFPGVFPKGPRPARTMYAAYVSALPTDEKIALATLQGVVNRRQPRIYLITDRSGPGGGKPSVDEDWLAWLKQRGDVAEVKYLKDPWELARLFRDELKGAIITDPKVPATVDVGTTMCGLDDAVLLSPRLAGKDGLKTIADLRGRWSTNVGADEWAVRNLWPRTNHFLLGLMYPGWAGPRDYLVAHRAFVFWITGRKDATTPAASPLGEQLVIERLLAKAPANIGVLGAPYAGVGVGIQEGPGVTMLSQYAKFLAWSSEVPNLSVHSGTTAAPFHHDPGPPPALDPTKAYVDLLVSDGDAPINWHYLFRSTYFDDPARKGLAITWSEGPSVHDLMPDIMDWYYRHAGPHDSFACAVSGVGYCFGDRYAERYRDPDAVYDGFLALTAKYMRLMDLHSLWTSNTTGRRLEQTARVLKADGVLTDLLPGYGRAATTTAADAAKMIAGVPSFHGMTGFDPKAGPEDDLALLLKQVKQYTPSQRPAFMNIFVQCYPASPTLLRRLIDRLGPDYVDVPPEWLAALYREAQAKAGK